MCGIFCYISKDLSTDVGSSMLAQCQCLLNNRGPNWSRESIHCSRVLLHSTVLWQQGSEACLQPIENERFMLLFNGDLFNERDDLVESDTQWLFRRIASTSCLEEFCDLFKTLRGPFSLIVLDKQLQRVYFGRDSIGRNSLLMGTTEGGIVITSVTGKTCKMETMELVPDGIYYVDIGDNDLRINLVPWKVNEDASKSFNIFNELFIELPWFKKFEKALRFNYHSILKDREQTIEIFDYLHSISPVAKLCEQLLDILSESVRERVVNTPNHCKVCLPLQEPCQHSRLGVLFSGGIDCTIIALLADRFVPSGIPIDLLNVAFEKIIRPATQKSKTPNCVRHSVTTIDWNVPDRLTGLQTLQELQKLRPNRKWNFVEINVTRKELDSRKERISDLVFPLKSVLDESLGAALWFASRGEGMLNGVEYQSPCRVVLLGSGADELFGGYSRHRVAFHRDFKSKDVNVLTDEDIEQAFSNLAAELDMDWNRLPSRNLARDDRVICDHGITPRTPYLQEDFVALVQGLHASQRCYHPLGEGIGDKLTLRLCGHKLGLQSSATLRKRALQFGSRIADRKQNANDSSAFLS